MAHSVTSPMSIQVHQTVHGYSSGHSMLASSVDIKPRDQKNMLVMSDASGPSSNILEDGYFTGYPLGESGMYVLAKTWPANEMDRPGCVWTHSLLISFPDLARLSNLNWLTTTFRRPTSNTLASKEFHQVLSIVPPDQFDERLWLTNKQLHAARQIIWALYTQPQSKIVASANIHYSVVFSIWAQQWPRLRRAFRFCTLAFADRSTDSAPFDLQLIPLDRSTKSRFVKTVDADQIKIDSDSEWLRCAIADIATPNREMRTFFRDFGSDLTAGRSSFVPLCQLYQLLDEFYDPARSLDQAVIFAEERFKDDTGIGIRALIITSAAKHAQQITDHSLLFAVGNLDLLKSPLSSKEAFRLVAELWHRSPETLIEVSKKHPTAHSLSETLFKQLPLGELAVALETAPMAVSAVLEVRPEIISVTDLWKKPQAWQERAFDTARENNLAQPLLNAAFQADRVDLARTVNQEFGASEVLRALDNQLAENRSANQSHTFSSWLTESLRDPRQLTDALRSRLIHRRKLIYEIAVRTKPADVDSSRPDAWMLAEDAAKAGELSLCESRYLCTYMLARAIECSQNTGELISLSLDCVYSALAVSELPHEAWTLLEQRLPKAAWYWEWDRCRRIREVIADLSLNGRIQPMQLFTISENDALFVALIETIWWRKHGHRYVSDLKSLARNHSHGDLANRIRLLKQFH